MDLDKIYNDFKTIADKELDGFEILQKSKKKCKCDTHTILLAQSKHRVKEIRISNRVVYSHTTIYDFGITPDDIKKSLLEDKK